MPGLRLSYWNPRLSRTVFYQLQQQQKTGLFCDVTLQGDGEAIHAHSCVLAACSPYLANLLMCPTEISNVSDCKTPLFSNRPVLRIHEIKSLHLFPLVHYMYTSELEVAPGDVSGVLKAARKLQIPELELLKLEGGRLVRTEPGRRLNRNCLGGKTQIHRAKAVNQGVLNSDTNIEIKPRRNSDDKIENDMNSAVLLNVKPSNEYTLETGTGSFNTSETELGNLDFLDLLCSGSSLEKIANSHGYLKNVQGSCNLLQCAVRNQNSQEDAPSYCSLIRDVASSQVLIENALSNQVFEQDLISNQNTQVVDARSLDLMECKPKGSLDTVPSCQYPSEQIVNIYGLHDNVKCSRDSFANVHSIGLVEDMQTPKELPEDVQSIGELLGNVNGIGELPVNMQNIGELPEHMHSSEELLETALRCDDTQENMLNSCRTSDEPNKSNPEVMPGQEREYVVECIQSRYHTKSKKKVLRRIRLDRTSEEIASVDTEVFKCKGSDVNLNNISVSNTFGKHNAFNVTNMSEDVLDQQQLSDQCDKPHYKHWHNLNRSVELSEQLADESESQGDALHLVGLKGCILKTERNVLHNNECVDKVLILSSEITSPPASDVSVSHSVPLACSKEEFSSVMMDLQNKATGYVLKSSTHCESKANEVMDHAGLTSNAENGSKQSEPVHRKDYASNDHCESEISGIVDHEGLTSFTDHESKHTGSVDQGDSLSSSTCDPETRVVYVSNNRVDESRKRQRILDDSLVNELKKVKLRKANDGLSWEVLRGVESLNITCPVKAKEYLTECEEQVEQMLNVTTPMSPDVDVGVYSPPMFLEACVWPDLSSESDTEIDILG